MLRLDGEAGGRQQCFGPFFGATGYRAAEGGPPNFHLITVNEGHTQLQMYQNGRPQCLTKD